MKTEPTPTQNEMNRDEICAWCRHWMIGSTTEPVRMNALIADQRYTCHVSREETAGSHTCRMFDRCYCRGDLQ